MRNDDRDPWEIGEVSRGGLIAGTLDYGHRDRWQVYMGVTEEMPLDLRIPRQAVLAVLRLARDRRLVTIKMGAGMFGVERKTLYDWAIRGAIYSVKKPPEPGERGAARWVWVDPREVAAYRELTYSERVTVNRRRRDGISYVEDVREGRAL